MENRKMDRKSSVIGGLVIVALVGAFFIGYSLTSSNASVSLFGTCSIDNINGATKVNGTWVSRLGIPLVVQGWAADRVASAAPNQALVELVDKQDRVINSWQGAFTTARPDVSKAFKNPFMSNSGLNISLGKIKNSGVYSLVLGDINSGQRQLCVVPYTLKINP